MDHTQTAAAVSAYQCGSLHCGGWTHRRTSACVRGALACGVVIGVYAGRAGWQCTDPGYSFVADCGYTGLYAGRLIREYIRYVAVFCLMCYPTMVWSWLFKVKVIAYGSLKLKEITYFGEITGPSSLSIQHYSGKQILRHFWKADIQYFIENYGWLLKLVAIWPFSEETLLQGPL